MNRDNTRKAIKIASAIIFVILLLGYAGFELKKIALGPKIKLLSPYSGATVSESLLEIVGNAENIKDIRLNDRKIFTDEQGNFKEKMLLSYGYNVIKIKAEDRFGQETDKTIEIIYK